MLNVSECLVSECLLDTPEVPHYLVMLSVQSVSNTTKVMHLAYRRLYLEGISPYMVVYTIIVSSLIQ